MFSQHVTRERTNFDSRWRLVFCAFAGLFLAACSSIPKARDECIGGPNASISTDANVQRIADLERQLAEQQRKIVDQQRLMSDQRRLMSERRRLSLEEKRQLERQIKEGQIRSDELQRKLDAIISIDRDLRPGTKDH